MAARFAAVRRVLPRRVFPTMFSHAPLAPSPISSSLSPSTQWIDFVAPPFPLRGCRSSVSGLFFCLSDGPQASSAFHRYVHVRRRFSSSPSSQAQINSKAEEHHDVRSVSFKDLMASVGTAPVVPMILGLAGAVPFLTLTPPLPHFLPLPEVLSAHPIEAQTSYAAVILSFLGAPHWGLAMVGIRASPGHKIFNFAINTLRYIWSVIPCLVAWVALLLSTIPKLQLLIFGFGLVLGVDMFFARQGLTPPWFFPLRLLLSGIVILCLLTSLIEVFLMDKLNNKKETAEEKS